MMDNFKGYNTTTKVYVRFNIAFQPETMQFLPEGLMSDVVKFVFQIMIDLVSRLCQAGCIGWVRAFL